MLDLKINDPSALPYYFGVFEDFIEAGSVATGHKFTGTAISSGTLATNAANGGWAKLSGAATTDNSGYQIQALGAHVCTSSKPIVFKTRVQVSESTSSNSATESDIFLGLFPIDTSIEASLPDNGIYFVKADGGTTVQCIVRAAAANGLARSIASSAFTLVAGTNYRFGIAVFPNGTDSSVEFTIDDVVVARATGLTLPASTVYLTPSVVWQTGDNTGTKWIDVDYLASYQVR